MCPAQPKIVATYHGIAVPDGPHLGPQMLRNMEAGRYERREIQLALGEVRASDRVVEMGAGAGIVGAVVAKNCAPQKMVAFEANYKLIDYINALYTRNALDDRIEVRNQIILSAKNPPEKVDFFIRGNFLGSGMTITKGEARAEKVEVPVVAWDAVKAEVDPTVLIMDIEGAELDFFRHADLSGIRAVIVELHRHIYDRPGMREIRERLMVDKGFKEDTDRSGGGVFVFRREERL